jgi:hypothetical protein
VKPHKVRYYLEQRDPDFAEKMAEVLCVYRQVKILKQAAAVSKAKKRPSDAVAIISYDEKPGMLVPGLLTVPLECRHADGFSFRAVGRPHVAIAAIELCKVAGEFVTQGEFTGRRVPTGVGRAAALHFQREGSRPSEVVCRTPGHRFQ